MNFFFDPSVVPIEESTYCRSTPSYLEFQKHSVDSPGASYTYLLQWSDHAYFIAACWGHQFDEWVPLLQDRKMGKTWLGVVKETYPTLGQLLENGIAGRYSEGALLNIEDPDDGERKWVVGTVVGNLSVTSVEELEQVLLSDRMMQAYSVVLVSSFIGLEELATRTISAKSKLKSYGRAMFNAQVESIELAAIWVPKIVNLFSKS
ncbi:MAG TPA: hypothetical protein VNM92_05285 [Thermoanaerobaculia bacterium]|nr:hypothetical protein [Thermoanaerobaculia bacterium]